MSVHHSASRDLWFSKWMENGKEKRRYFKTEGEAYAFDDERKASLQLCDQMLTLGELTMLYFKSNPDKHRETKRHIVHFLAGHEDKKGRHIAGAGEFLRDKYAERLTRQDLERMREECRLRGTGNCTINKHQAYIRAILAWGVEQDLIHFNPWRDYKRLKVVRPMITVNVDDLRKLYAELPPYLQWAAKTAFFLALRPGQVELFNLKWSAFNWGRGFVAVRQGKSGKIKTVLLHPAYGAEALERYKEDTKKGIPYVCHRNGQHISNFRTAWNSACRRAGVQMRPYDIRHIAATEMLARGADLAAVAAQLGHSSVTTTGAFYAHVAPGSQAFAAQMMPLLEGDTGGDTSRDTKVIQQRGRTYMQPLEIHGAEGQD